MYSNYDKKRVDNFSDDNFKESAEFVASNPETAVDGSASVKLSNKKYVPLTVFIVILIAAVFLTAGLSWFILNSGETSGLQGTVMLKNDLKTVENFSNVIDDKAAAEIDKPDSVDESAINTSGKRSAAGSYLNSLEGNTSLFITDKNEHKNLVNGKTSISEDDVNNSITITKTEKIIDDDYERLAKRSYALPATVSSRYIFPGAVLYADKNAAYGYVSSVKEELGKGRFKIDGSLKSDASKDFELDKPTDKNIKDVLYSSLSNKACYYDIRVADVTSPEQTAIELGAASEDINRFLDGYWESIRTGSKQIAVAYIRRNVAEVRLNGTGADGNFSDLGKLFSDNVSVDDIKILINDRKNSQNTDEFIRSAMYVKKVKYGNAYLVAAILNSGNAYDPSAANSFRDLPELKEGLINYFRGDSDKMNQSQKEALSYAELKVSRIGGKAVNDSADIEKWSPSEQITLSSLTSELAKNYKYTYGDTLVPLSYEANSVSGRQDPMSIFAEADKFKTTYITGTVSGDIKVEEGADGVFTEREILKVYGLDIDQFNSNNMIKEHVYLDSNDTYKGRFKAYECVFGISADASALGCTCRAYNADRIVQNGIYKGLCTGKNVGNNGVITKRVNLEYGITAYTTDWSRDCYFILNNVEYKGTNGRSNDKGSNVRIERVWDATKNGNDLKNYNSASPDKEIIDEAVS